MSKFLFIGPSLHGRLANLDGLIVSPPACQGDIFAAVELGAAAIGLVDGVFGFVPSVWHKEILYALENGVHLLGAASMGALRAAECAAFGMTPVGRIAERFLNGTLTRDADVCLVHAPAELDYAPLSEPLVDVEPTLAALCAAGRITENESAQLWAHAEAMYFGDRTLEAMLTALPPHRQDAVTVDYANHRVRQKQIDALALVAALRALPDRRGPPPDWTMVRSRPWQAFLQRRGARD